MGEGRDSVICPNCASAAELRPATEEGPDVETVIACPACKYEAARPPRPYEDLIGDHLDRSGTDDRG